VGPLLAIFVVISLNMAPDGAQTVTLDSYVVEGVGISADATRFLLTRMDEGRWLLHDAQGRPWYTVEVDGPWLTLTTQAGTSDRIDLGAALGLPAEPWWASDQVAPPGSTPAAAIASSSPATTTPAASSPRTSDSPGGGG